MTDALAWKRAVTAACACGEAWTVYTSPVAATIAAPCAKGRYQASLLDGGEAWSGSTLQGATTTWGARYLASRDALLGRLTATGLDVRFVRVRDGRPHGGGRRVAVISIAE